MSASASAQEDLLGVLERQADRLARHCAAGSPVVRLGLITTLYFKHGHSREIRSRIAECFVRFHDAFEPVLGWQSLRRGGVLTGSGFAASCRGFPATPADQPAQWSVASCPESAVAEYRLTVTSLAEGQNEIDRSCLKMVLPWTVLCEPDGLQTYELWMSYLCSQVRAEHGFGGLSCILPCEGQRHLAVEYPLARRFRGLMVDPCPHIESLRLLDHIKGISWYTVVGSHFVRRLGGNDHLRRRLSTCSDIVFQVYDGGLMMRAGVAPQLLDHAQLLPPAYVQLNRALKPVRLQDASCPHPYSVIGGGLPNTVLVDWYGRFDEKPKPPLDAGSRCTHSGYWFSNARVGSLRYFGEGDVMPSLDPAGAQRTRWFWSEQGD